jgi:hypothetical protein
MRLSRLTMRRWIVAVAVAAPLFGLGLCLISHIRTSIQIALADEQTAIFDQMRRQTAESPAVDVSYLEYALWYYPSGTKQTKGSGLDRVVERARQCAVREMIGILRSRTRKDFGDDPRRWIEELRSNGAVGPMGRNASGVPGTLCRESLRSCRAPSRSWRS